MLVLIIIIINNQVLGEEPARVGVEQEADEEEADSLAPEETASNRKTFKP